MRRDRPSPPQPKPPGAARHQAAVSRPGASAPARQRRAAIGKLIERNPESAVAVIRRWLSAGR